ncbi:uncharacterized protein TNIN_111031 [Trichonephila inaurata madagascariensis]|uniref:Uncharacterized protein n=1 Tax=Trichonephila inaurata madagascariensis TaxID=2747483 RepID=A0A8X6XDS5_9ARAC|nr:uncharacterized protein TNIN_111031 [Trichonephila inaurata madagascariensis]
MCGLTLACQNHWIFERNISVQKYSLKDAVACPLNKEISASTIRMPISVQFLSQTISVAKCSFWSQKGTRSHLHRLVIIDLAVCVGNGVGRFRSFPPSHSSAY